MGKTKKKPEFKVTKKRSGRYAVLGRDGKYINGEEKVKILLKEGLIKLSKATKKEAPTEEAAE